MVAELQLLQRITRLTPLGDALDAVGALARAVKPRDADLASALHRTLAEDAAAAVALPPQPLALRDGWALRSEATMDASPYAPLILSEPPVRIDAGELLPVDSDSIAPLETVIMRDGHTQIIGAVPPGDGVLPAAADAGAGQPLRRAGEKLRASDIAVLSALGVDRVRIREPRLHVVPASRSRMTAASLALITTAIATDGGHVIDHVIDVDHEDKRYSDNLEAAFRHESADAVIVVGGTGTGRYDRSVEMLGRVGRIVFHGVGLHPGDTSAFGIVGERPILLLPGRIDAALAGWLVLGREFLARLCGYTEEKPHMTTPPAMAALSRKVVSTVGIADVVLVRCVAGKIEPLASGHWPLQALARADGWILVPADSEGYPAETKLAVRPLR